MAIFRSRNGTQKRTLEITFFCTPGGKFLAPVAQPEKVMAFLQYAKAVRQTDKVSLMGFLVKIHKVHSK